MAFLDFLTARTLRDENETLHARVAYFRAENVRLRAELADRKARNHRALSALHILMEHLESCAPADPGADLLAELKNSDGPPACTAEGPTSPESTSTGDH